MTDSQWPRFEVFLQDREGHSHRNVGTVHASDSELALQNARDVFVRRPSCQSLWVVPATAIYALTKQEIRENAGLSADDSEQQPKNADLDEKSYLVFQKRNQRRTMSYVEYVGRVDAATPGQAMAGAITAFDDPSSTVWWVCPASVVARSTVDDVESMFTPATEKAYRMPQHYRIIQQMLEAKSRLLGKADIEQDA